jgi:hypothetical protein
VCRVWQVTTCSVSATELKWGLHGDIPAAVSALAVTVVMDKRMQLSGAAMAARGLRKSPSSPDEEHTQNCIADVQVKGLGRYTTCGNRLRYCASSAQRASPGSVRETMAGVNLTKLLNGKFVVAGAEFDETDQMS